MIHSMEIKFTIDNWMVTVTVYLLLFQLHNHHLVKRGFQSHTNELRTGYFHGLRCQIDLF